MPAYTRGRLREKITFVLLFKTPANIYYNWSAKDIATLAGVSSADLTNHLGHLTTVPADSIVIVGASSPKPVNVRKIINRNPTAAQQGAVSTFCSPGTLNTALTNGWKISGKGRISRVRNDNRTKTALAKISNEMIYASPMNADDHNTYAAELGLVDPSTVNTQAERNSIVSGASRPRAAHAIKKLPDGAEKSGYYSYDADILSNGWAPDSPEIL